MKVLVTGGAGFIGSHTVDLLLEEGYDVRIIDNLQSRVHPHGKPGWVPAEAEFLKGDVSNSEDLARSLRGVDFVVHLAAYQDYLPDFSRFIHTNTESSALLFELIVSDREKYPVRKVVLASSQAVCGEGRYMCPQCAGGLKLPSLNEQLTMVQNGISLEISESAVRVPSPRPLDQLHKRRWELLCPKCSSEMAPLLISEETTSPGTAYGISKYATELLAERLGRRYQIATVCLRYTYVQGARNSFYNAYSGIARRFALRLLNALPPVVYEDGKQLRDYVNVRDVARANLLAIEDPRTDFQVLNVGGGRAVSVWEFARIMLDTFESDLETAIPGEFRLGDTRHTVSDISRMRALGWEPTIPVEQNVKEYLAWMRQQETAPEFLEQAERVMRERGVVQHAQSS